MSESSDKSVANRVWFITLLQLPSTLAVQDLPRRQTLATFNLRSFNCRSSSNPLLHVLSEYLPLTVTFAMGRSTAFHVRLEKPTWVVVNGGNDHMISDCRIFFLPSPYNQTACLAYGTTSSICHKCDV